MGEARAKGQTQIHLNVLIRGAEDTKHRDDKQSKSRANGMQT